MAKIKISGYQDMISVSESEAKRLRELKRDDKNKDKYVEAGSFGGQLKDIRAIMLIKDDVTGQSKEYLERYKEYTREKESLLQLSERERAEAVAWTHFSLFFWGMKYKSPSEGVKEDVIKKATEFFEKNKYWTVPSLKCYYELFPKLVSNPLNNMASRVLLEIERRQLIEAGESQKFYEGDIIPENIF